MDLERALEVASRPLVVSGESDPSLASVVSRRCKRDMRAVRELDGGRQLRVADVLLSLAVATAPKINNAELYDVYKRWAQLRYLGAFETSGAMDDELALSPIGAAVAAGQRRVFSEELGIGFTTWLSQYWRIPGLPESGVTRQLIDADLAWTHGIGKSRIMPIGSRRPDYVIVQQNVDGSSSLAFLECKGASNRHTALQQLAKASVQLASGRIGHLQPPRLAISIVMNHRTMKYLAIQRPWGDTFESPSQDLPSRDFGTERRRDVAGHSVKGRWEDAPTLPESGGPVVRLREFENAQEAFVAGAAAEDAEPIGMATSAAMVASWSALADFAGNEEAFTRWTEPSAQMSDLPRRPQARTELVTRDGEVIRGVSNTVAVPGGRLQVVLGLLAFVDEALSNGSSSTIIDAQREAEAASAGRASSADSSDSEVTAFGRDGSALVIRAAD